MKWKLLVLAGLCWGVMGVAYADDPAAVPSAEPALINHPQTGWQLTKSFVTYAQPGADFIVSFTDGPAQTGLSGAIFSFENNGFLLASVRAGYGLDNPTTYGSLALDLPGLAGRFIPAAVKGVSPGALNGALAFAANFVRIGPVAGFDWSKNKPVWGIGIGAALTTSF